LGAGVAEELAGTGNVVVVVVVVVVEVVDILVVVTAMEQLGP